ncbi:hypothetical protein E2562_036842 [Oryza meyeriana var. granulata]|uniref:Uncharacterized protein n=1 Tax=Oryza meyeriana var. granulata TaxID=110450 RepID=A0A6G1E7K1_9ORYZ|nr:hypothetical protein E2562_036842 [Oryza meyeriana var. granulata]
MGAADDNHEEASPFLPQAGAGDKLPPSSPPPPPAPEAAKCCADGVPVVMGSPLAAPAGGVLQESWNSGLLSCLGRNDEFCSSDIEVCTCISPSDLSGVCWGLRAFLASDAHGFVVGRI